MSGRKHAIQHKKRSVIFIVGPTASGKSALGVALAKKVRGEIISCDSMQVYQGIDILSDKPDRRTRRAVRHHLVDVLPLTDDFNASVFVKRAQRLIPAIHKRNHIPIIVGGTGLYLNALLYGLFEGPGRDDAIRARLEREADNSGNVSLHERLKEIDPQAARKIHPNDLRRIIRALEVYELTKTPISELQKQCRGLFDNENLSVFVFGLQLPRHELYKRINQRVTGMMTKGIIDEVERILTKRPSKTLRQALGIKEVALYLDGRITRYRAECMLKRNTRRFAKRQLTWFRKNTTIQWIDGRQTQGALVKQIMGILQRIEYYARQR